MEPLWAALEATAAAEWTRQSRWGYAAVNTLHILGIALLVGAIVPLDLRRIGVFRTVPHEALARVLVPTAGTGLALAILTGTLLFASRASEYASMGVFQLKVGLVAAGTVVALLLHRAFGLFFEAAGPRRALHAALSAATWLAVLTLGRLIAFV